MKKIEKVCKLARNFHVVAFHAGNEAEGSGYVWRGSIATVAMYNGPKTPEEVLEIHQTMALSGNLCPAL